MADWFVIGTGIFAIGAMIYLKLQNNAISRALINASMKHEALSHTLDYARDELIQVHGPVAGENLDKYYKLMAKQVFEQYFPHLEMEWKDD